MEILGIQHTGYVRRMEAGLVNLEYIGYEISDGKPKLPGLPASSGSKKDVQTLKVYMEDAVAGLKVCLLYSVFASESVITRSVIFLNKGKSRCI